MLNLITKILTDLKNLVVSLFEEDVITNQEIEFTEHGFYVYRHTVNKKHIRKYLEKDLHRNL